MAVDGGAGRRGAGGPDDRRRLRRLRHRPGAGPTSRTRWPTRCATAFAARGFAAPGRSCPPRRRRPYRVTRPRCAGCVTGCQVVDVDRPDAMFAWMQRCRDCRAGRRGRAPARAPLAGRSRATTAAVVLLVHGLSSNARLWDEVAAPTWSRPGTPSTRSTCAPTASPTRRPTATTPPPPPATWPRDRGAWGWPGRWWPGSPGAATWWSGWPPAIPNWSAALALVDGGWIDLSAEFD